MEQVQLLSLFSFSWPLALSFIQAGVVGLQESHRHRSGSCCFNGQVFICEIEQKVPIGL